MAMTATEYKERRDRNNRRFAEAVADTIKTPRDVEALGEVVKSIMGEEFPEAGTDREQFTGMCHRLAELWQYANDSMSARLGQMMLGAPPVRDGDNYVAVDEANITGIMRMIDLGDRNIPDMINDRIRRVEHIELKCVLREGWDAPFHERLNRKPWEKH